MNPKTKAAEILVIDEYTADTNHIKTVFEKAKTVNNLRIYNNYAQGFEYIMGLNKFFETKPDIIILEISTLNGNINYDIITEIKSNPDLIHIPVIIFSRLDSPDVVKKCYELNISSFISKSNDINELIRTVEKLESFWFTIAKLSFLMF